MKLGDRLIHGYIVHRVDGNLFFANDGNKDSQAQFMVANIDSDNIICNPFFSDDQSEAITNYYSRLQDQEKVNDPNTI